jgi:hypothetical protein
MLLSIEHGVFVFGVPMTDNAQPQDKEALSRLCLLIRWDMFRGYYTIVEVFRI